MAITDEDSALAWLNEQTNKGVALAILARTSLRSLPALGDEQSERRGDLTLRVLRATEFLVVAAQNQPAVSRFAKRNLRNSVARFARSAYSSVAADLVSLGNYYALKAVEGLPSRLNQALEGLVGAATYLSKEKHSSTKFAAYSALGLDAQRLTNGIDILSLFYDPLWPLPVNAVQSPPEPEVLSSSYISLANFFDSDPQVWGFWKRWLEGMRNGQPMDLSLQEQVALIPDEVWEAGPKAIAARIDEIEKRFALKAALQEAETEMVRDAAQRLGIGGNNPPEQIEDLPPSPEFPTIIWEPFETLKQEVEKPEPDTKAVQGAIAKLTALLSVCGTWFGGKLDKSADEFFKSLGKWAGPAFIGYLATHSPQIQAVLTAAKDWLLTLLS